MTVQQPRKRTREVYEVEARNEALEEAAQVIDQCNREGPYNAIQGASRIRSLAAASKTKGGNK